MIEMTSVFGRYPSDAVIGSAFQGSNTILQHLAFFHVHLDLDEACRQWTILFKIPYLTSPIGEGEVGYLYPDCSKSCFVVFRVNCRL
jgi:hypothetical protein